MRASSPVDESVFNESDPTIESFPEIEHSIEDISGEDLGLAILDHIVD